MSMFSQLTISKAHVSVMGEKIISGHRQTFTMGTDKWRAVPPFQSSGARNMNAPIQLKSVGDHSWNIIDMSICNTHVHNAHVLLMPFSAMDTFWSVKEISMYIFRNLFCISIPCSTALSDCTFKCHVAGRRTQMQKTRQTKQIYTSYLPNHCNKWSVAKKE